MITRDQNGSCLRCIDTYALRATTRHNGAVKDCQMSLNGL